MPMTETEAKTKWCPLLAIGRGLTNEQHHCVGSRCMFWTFGDDQKEEKSTCLEVLGERKEPTGEAPIPEGDGWVKVGGLRRSDGHLYKPNGYEPMKGPFTMFWQKWERERAPEKREGDCSITL